MSLLPRAAGATTAARKLFTLVLLAERSGPHAAKLSDAPVLSSNPPTAFASPYSRLLLGMKKRGFGKGLWNGFGGKIEKGETPRQAAVREMKEEAGIDLLPSSLSKRAVLVQEFEGSSDPLMEIHVYLASLYTGVPMESDEMRPQWFPVDSLPFDHMWADDRHWYPFILSEAEPRFHAHFLFRGQTTLLSHSIKEMSPEDREETERMDDIAL